MTTDNNALTPAALLSGKDHRLVIQATLKPAAGQDRFQPAGFPEIGHVIYDAPRRDGSTAKVCIVDSAASMANHLEGVCVDRFSMELVPELTGLPYVQCLTDNGTDKKPERLVVTTLSEGHRLASSLFTDDKSKVIEKDGQTLSAENLGQVLLREFGLVDLGKRSHPLPADWWKVFSTIFRYDPNSLVHGILFPAMGIKIPRVLTAHMEAHGAARVASSGVKFDKLLMTTSGQPIFAKDEETAQEIRATFILDLSLIRSFGRGTNGLNDAQKQLLLGLALWKIGKLVEAPFRYRSGCDLELDKLERIIGKETASVGIADLSVNIADAIKDTKFPDPAVTKIYWPSGELFKKAKDKKDVPEDAPAGAESDDNSDTEAEETEA